MRKTSFAQISALICALTLMMGVARASSGITTTTDSNGNAVETITLATPVTVSATSSSTITKNLLSGTTVGSGETLNNVPGLTEAGTTTYTWTGTPTATGSYTQHLTAGGNSLDFLIDVLNPNGNPNAPKLGSFTAVPSPAGVNTQVQFTATSTDADGDHVSYYWDFGDNSNARVQNPQHTYTTAGTYNVSVTLWDGSKFSSKVQKLVVSAATAGTLTISKALFQLDFRTTSKDRVQLSGTCVIGNSSAYTAQTATWHISNALSRGPYTFAAANSSGVSLAGDSSNAISIKTLVTGAPNTQNQVAVGFDMKGSGVATLVNTPLGFANAKITRNVLTIPLGLTLTGLSEQTTTFDVVYTASKNRRGIGKK